MYNFCFKYFFIIFYLLSTNIVFAEIPVIVISAGKNKQSESTIGSDITLVNKEEILSNNSKFIADVIDYEIGGSNFSRQGGIGSNSLVQIHGLPKRYTNVYLDGVKLADPSTPDDSFYFNHLTTSSIGSIEVLKGSQSSLYGSGAIGGVINLFSNSKTSNDEDLIKMDLGSNNTKNIALSLSRNFKDHFLTFTGEKFFTKNTSIMTDNDEHDIYKNDSIYFGHKYNFDNSTSIETNLRYIDTFFEYDEVTSGRSDNNNSKDKGFIGSIKLKKKYNKFENQLILGNHYNKRKVGNYNQTSFDTYYGERKNINYSGIYKFNLDSKVVFGLENEFYRGNYTTWAVSGNKISDDTIYSQFFDYQKRINKKTFLTFGGRNDSHSVAGNFQTGRVTLAFNKNNSTKIRSSIGTGLRFGSLNDYYYDTNVQNKKRLKPEKSYSIDFGIDKNLFKNSTKLKSTVFYSEYDDHLANWQSNTDQGRSSYVIENSSGKIKTKGIDIFASSKFRNDIFANISYTYTHAYDGEDCDNPDLICSVSSYPVRVPKHSMKFELENKLDKRNHLIQLKYVSSRRDYGNANNSFRDVLLDDYYILNLKNKLKLFGIEFYVNIDNILNKKYEDAFQYSSIDRSLNFGINKRLNKN